MLFIAMVGFVATSCSKTIVKDEVETAISFSTESGKLTRAIVQNNAYSTEQPFGVFAYSHQKDEAGNVIAEKTTTVMNNVEVYYDKTVANNPVWRASGDVKYYWPNDPRTSMDFYAFSPACSTANVTKTLAAHQQLNGTVAHTEAAGFSLTGYVHSNMYVDFMVATPVKGATYVDPSGTAANPNNQQQGEVPLVFNHKMTQILFNVTTDVPYPGVTFTIEKIALKNVRDEATYASDAWTVTNDSRYEGTNNEGYVIFPADTDNGAILSNSPDNTDNTVEAEISLQYASNANELLSMTTTGVTMIPQTMAQCSTEYVAGSDAIAAETFGQMFEIVYSISGTGVAKETVTKHIPFWPSVADISKQGQNYQYNVVHWGPNKRVTYKVKIGLNEVTFEPSVANWEENVPAGNTYTFVQ